MSDIEAYELLQRLLTLAEQIRESGHYTTDEIKDEIQQRLGD